MNEGIKSKILENACIKYRLVHDRKFIRRLIHKWKGSRMRFYTSLFTTEPEQSVNMSRPRHERHPAALRETLSGIIADYETLNTTETLNNKQVVNGNLYALSWLSNLDKTY